MSDDPTIRTPEPEKLPVIDFDFYFTGRESARQVTVWPSLGDTWVYTPEGWRFSFPRLNTTHEVFKRNMLDASMVETTRTPFDLKEFQRKMDEAKKAKHVQTKG
jgi:hypothetical protein